MYARMETFCITFEFISHHHPVGKFLLLMLLLLFSTVYNFPLFLFLFSSLLCLASSLSPVHVYSFLMRSSSDLFSYCLLSISSSTTKAPRHLGFVLQKGHSLLKMRLMEGTPPTLAARDSFPSLSSASPGAFHFTQLVWQWLILDQKALGKMGKKIRRYHYHHRCRLNY